MLRCSLHLNTLNPDVIMQIETLPTVGLHVVKRHLEACQRSHGELIYLFLLCAFLRLRDDAVGIVCVDGDLGRWRESAEFVAGSVSCLESADECSRYFGSGFPEGRSKDGAPVG